MTERATEHTDGHPIFHAESLPQWHDWLDAHHRDARGIWLAVWKRHTGHRVVAHADTVDWEANGNRASSAGWTDARRASDS